MGNEMKQENAADILLQSRLCKGLTREQVITLLQKGHSEIKGYEKGDWIFGETDRPEKLFLLLSGSVAASRDTIAGKRMMLMKVDEPGDLFGEIYFFLEMKQYDMYAEAMEKSVVLVLDRETFSMENYENPSLVYLLQRNLMMIFAQKAYLMNKKLKIVGGASIREKIARYLIDLQDAQGKICGNMNREDMADYMNVTRPSLSRELGKMQQEGILVLQNHIIRVTDQKKLEEYL